MAVEKEDKIKDKVYNTSTIQYFELDHSCMDDLY